MSERIWDILLSKTQVAASKASSKVKSSKTQLEIDIARGARLDTLIEEYHSQLLLLQERPQSTQQVQAIRSFISQVHQLKSKNIDQIDNSKKALNEARVELNQAEKERLKFNSLLDIEKEGARELAFKAEEKQLNEQATIQFNLKNKS
tara:strand:- start:122 stop:565 length:444 start_codon:yes stop_codon:yes gene_type:complete